VKNAVIVPTGAKGGFYPKQLPDPARPRCLGRRGRAFYQIFVRSCSLTDNIAGGQVVPRRHGVRDDDPYFVVAADKGTATFPTPPTGWPPRRISGWTMPSPAAAQGL
jgi:glutamate dehydrogenase